MKIGILTYHGVYNFGANLQVHSTVNYLKKQGLSPMVINWIPEELEKGYDRSNPPEQALAHKDFIRKNIPLTKLCRNEDDIVGVIEDCKLNEIIIGSDAVLQHQTLFSRLRVTKKGIKIKEKRSNTIYPNPFWGSFIPMLKKKIPVTVMSASSQNTPYKQIRGRIKRELEKSIKRFKTITVRDEWTRQMILYLTRGDIDPVVTPDPVFAYNQNVADQLDEAFIRKKFNLSEKYILLSFKNKGVVSEKWIEEFRAKAEVYGFTAVLMTMPGGIIFKDLSIKTIPPPLNPAEWYALIKYASGYVGENMHPIVVSLHNVVPFFSFDNYGIIKFKYFLNEKSSKIYDILSRADFLENRISSLGKHPKYISPGKVLEILEKFDKNKCNIFKERQVEDYNEMMKRIISK